MRFVKLGKLKSGEVVYDRSPSHIHDGIEAILPLVLAEISAQNRSYFASTVHLDTTVGVSNCVSTDDTDEIVWAQRVGRLGMSRFVKNRIPEPTSVVTIVLKRNDKQRTYLILTAFAGESAEPEPGDKNATEKSRAFWASNALIWGSRDVLPETETSQDPW